MSEFDYRYTRARVGEKAIERLGGASRNELREPRREDLEEVGRSVYRYARPTERVRHTYRRGIG